MFNTQIRVYDPVKGSIIEVIRESHRTLGDMCRWFNLVEEVNPQVTNCNIQVRFPGKGLTKFATIRKLHEQLAGDK